MSETDPAPPRRSTTKTTVIAAIVLVVTFAAGVLVGVFIDRIAFRRGYDRVPRFATAAMVTRLDRHLDLTPEQRKQIEAILERRHARINEVWSEVRPRVRREIEQTNEEIARVLTAEQRVEFEKMKMRLGPRHRRHHRGHREGPP